LTRAETSALLPAIIVLLPALAFYFAEDDFVFLAGAADCAGFGCLGMLNDHFSPVFRGILWLQYAVFGANPVGYYVVTILLHGTVVLLGMLLVKRLGYNAIWFALIFGLSAAHARVPTWITGQGQLLAAVLLLSSLHLALSGRWSLAIASHFLAMMSFTTGLLFFAVIAIILRSQSKPYILPALAYLASGAAYVGLRSIFASDDIQYDILKALEFIAGGHGQAVIGGYTGITPVLFNLGVPFPPATGMIILLCCAAIFLRNRLAFSLLLCSIILYILPALPRTDWGYDWFATRTRYVYVPGIFFAAALTVFIERRRALQPLVACAVVLNAYLLVDTRILPQLEQTRILRSEVVDFVQRIENGECPEAELSTWAGWLATHDTIGAIYGVRCDS
jgi:hypothetical protein